jgi:hypothetical protein
MPEEEFTSRELMAAMLSLHEATEHSIGTLRQEVHARFDGVNERFDGVDARIDVVETRLTSLEGEVRGVETHLTSLEGEVRSIAGDVGGVKDWTHQVDHRFEAIAQAARITGI